MLLSYRTYDLTGHGILGKEAGRNAVRAAIQHGTKCTVAVFGKTFTRSTAITSNVTAGNTYLPAAFNVLFPSGTGTERASNISNLLTSTSNEHSQTYTGARLNQTLDWALSSVGDDVTAFLQKLTDLEKRLYYAAAIAATNHQVWKLHGNHRHRRTGITKKMPLPPQTSASSRQSKGKSLRSVTPTGDDSQRGNERPGRDKRMRT